jgi:hypothetical protein
MLKGAIDMAHPKSSVSAATVAAIKDEASDVAQCSPKLAFSAKGGLAKVFRERKVASQAAVNGAARSHSPY